jgi:hypothetical protein
VKVFSQLTLQAAYEWNYGERRFKSTIKLKTTTRFK